MVTDVLPTTSPAVAAYIQASNARDAAAQLACFAPDAVVTDEGHTYRGTAEIKEWIAKTKVYATVLELLQVTGQGNGQEVTCRVSGDFPGSPIQLCFLFTVEGERISALAIRP